MLGGRVLRTGPLKHIPSEGRHLCTVVLDVNGEEFEATVLGNRARDVKEARVNAMLVGTGRLKVHRWKTADGTSHQTLEVVLENVQLASKKP